jgi:hypothetical protein
MRIILLRLQTTFVTSHLILTTTTTVFLVNYYDLYFIDEIVDAQGIEVAYVCAS